MEKQRVLIVDDDESVQEFLQAALETSGYEAGVSSSATEALVKLKKEPGKYPVIISDIMMPGLSGLEFLDALKKDFPEIVVIMLTAYASMDTAIQSLNQGAFSYLKKPIDFEELKTTLRNAYEKFNLSQQNRQLVEDLKKAKEYSETIVRHLAYTVVATDPQGNIKKTNKAMEDLLGYPEQELIGRPLESILSDEFKRSTWKNLVEKGQVKDFPVALKSKNGSEIALQFTGTIMKDVHGNVIGFLGTMVPRQ